MSNEVQGSNVKYDLGERTALFGESVIDFEKGLSFDIVNDVLIKQVIRSATSIGANYCEADTALTKKEFRHRISISRKEAKETMHWFRMLARANEDHADQCRILFKESKELVLIFSKILQS
ncbi:MAG: four helix bundle protein [Parcubacteria group bacterium]|nr:four helix bundle protein [Parcubacteria group bacterium]|tara:strand:+ start:351 stop:713 length:363 start_codon:yes stop_codon:yes gene_type:complete